MGEKKRPWVNRKTCGACSVCAENCPMGCLEMEPPRFHGDISAVIRLARPEDCIGCGICGRVCPIAAITMR
ncbi:MAG: 4Fe-4S binding protein [Lachnospiraceae bacterium]|nr:4Fe-4S binding protein [Lachnospiraceae bacterium]